MALIQDKKAYYKALIAKDTQYEGIFYVGVKTTGIFCSPTCPARKPKFENCEFFETAEQALLASFRPCKRCRPLSHPNQTSELIQTLVAALAIVIPCHRVINTNGQLGGYGGGITRKEWLITHEKQNAL